MIVIGLGLILTGSVIIGCNNQPKLGKTQVDILTAQTTTKNQADTLKGLNTTVNGLTTQNLPAQKPLAVNQVQTAQNQNQQIATSLGTAAKSAAQDQQIIASASDPNKRWLQLFGCGLLVAGVLAVGAGIFLATKIPVVAPWLRSGGATAIIGGAALLCIAEWLHTIYWIGLGLIITAVICGGIWLWLHRKEIIPGLTAELKKVINI